MAMTAAALGIERKEFNALGRVRDGLRENRYIHVPSPESRLKPLAKGGFNMSEPCEAYQCGTVSCIGGCVALEMKMNAGDARAYVCSKSHDTSALNKLYYPEALEDWPAITPKQAARAIDNFLNTGDPQWARIASRNLVRK